MRDYVYHAQQRAQVAGLNPEEIPTFSTKLSADELTGKLQHYSEALGIIHFFIRKVLDYLHGIPVLVIVSDDQGFVLELSGDPSIRDIVTSFGIIPGVQFTEDECGPNVVSLTLLENMPIVLVGDDHHHRCLHAIACYGSVIHDMESNALIGSLSIMTTSNKAHDYFLPMLVTIVDSIERELLLISKNKRLDVLNHMILEATPNAVLLVDNVGTIQECNDHFLQYLGFKETELIGTSVLSVPHVGKYMDESRRLLTKFEAVELNIHNVSNDSTRICLFDSFPIFDSDKNALGALGQLRDITERIHTEKLLVQAEKLSVAGQLGAAFAHEIRNPLMVVKGFLQLLAEEDSIHFKHFNVISEEFKEIEQIVNTFLDITKSHDATSYHPCNIKSLIQSTLSLVYPAADMKGITLSLGMVETELFILGDEDNLKQIFLNLLNNAVESMDSAGTIFVNVTTSANGEEVCIEVRDQGRGIDPNILSKLGTPFYTTKDKGTGLGLTISSVLIKQHHGKIQFQEIPTTGTSVMVTFPILNESGHSYFA